MPIAIESGFANSIKPKRSRSSFGAQVDLPAPFDPAMATTLGISFINCDLVSWERRLNLQQHPRRLFNHVFPRASGTSLLPGHRQSGDRTSSATYIIGRATTWPSRTAGRSSMACRPRMPLCGGLMIGVESIEPYTPPLEIVNVPP